MTTFIDLKTASKNPNISPMLKKFPRYWEDGYITQKKEQQRKTNVTS
jgi:hypothetical protein